VTAVQVRLHRLAAVTATPRTTWVFAELGDGEGAVTTAELTLGDRSAQVARVLAELVAALQGCEAAAEQLVTERLRLTQERIERDVVLATAVSALRTAVAQLDAERAGAGLHRFLGDEDQHQSASRRYTRSGQAPERVELYANINRALHATNRTPTDFAGAAERAALAGFRSFKCAPFDEVSATLPPDRILSAAAAGLARVRAVRDAIGPAARLLVDCHSRFTAATAPAIAAELAQAGVGWFEEPLQPLTAAAALAEVARQVSMPVAGGEAGYGSACFDRLLETGAVSIIMPDIKHCGGVGEAVRAGRSALRRGGGFSLHSPSGPVSLLASAHVTAAVPGALPLEHAVGEASWRADLLTPAERIEDGHLLLPPTTGLGATLDWPAISRHGHVWTP
jgi:galactonate dehydratase